MVTLAQSTGAQMRKKRLNLAAEGLDWSECLARDPIRVAPLVVIVLVKWMLTSEHSVHNDTESPDVDSLTVDFPLSLLRCHIE